MLVTAIVAVFLLAAVTPALVRLMGREAGYLGAAVLGGLTVWLATHAADVLAGEPVTAEVAWIPEVDVTFALRMDALGLLFALIVLGIGAVVLAYSARYFGPRQRARASRYLSLLTLFAGSMLGLVLADDAIVMFAFWELTSVSSFFLIGGLGEGKQGATRAFLTTTIGGLALLAGVILLGVVGGTTSLSRLAADPSAVLASPLAPAIVVLLLLGVATKSAQIPFHFWLPGAMVAPTPVSTYLHAATMVKAGIYLLFRTTGILSEVPMWTPTLVILGGVTAVFAAATALKQDDLKSLLAYSTVSQLGMIVLVIGVGSPLALATAALFTLSHALYKATLFMTVGVIDHEVGARSLRELGGLRRTLPWTAAAGLLGAVSMAGLPPLLGFAAKEEAFAALLDAPGAGGLAVLGVTLAVVASFGTFAYSARYYLGTFEGVVTTAGTRPERAYAAPALVTGIAGLALGLAVPLLDPMVNGVARDTTGVSADLHLALWHGFTVPLALSVLVVTVGTGLVLAREQVAWLQRRTVLPSAARLFDRGHDGFLSLGARFGRSAEFDPPATYLLPVLAVVAITGTVAAVGLDRSLLAAPPPTLIGDVGILLLVLAATLAVVVAAGRLAAIAAIGLTGFTVAIWFVRLGAPDLALTQLLIETLTVGLVVVVFRRLPSAFPIAGPGRRPATALAAAVVGILAGGATYLSTGRRELSEIGGRLLAEGESLSGGGNVVNTILVDFRALDTLGELVVVAVAALGIVAMVRLVRERPVPLPRHDVSGAGGADPQPELGDARWGGAGMIGSGLLRTTTRLMTPAMVLASLWLLVRGHQSVGGGFIGGLTAGSAIVLLYFSAGHQRVWRLRWSTTLPLTGVGLLIAVGYGLGGLALADAFLAGAKLSLPLVGEVAASLVFDVAVYVVVIAIVGSIFRHLGQGTHDETDEPEAPSTAISAPGDRPPTTPSGARTEEVRP